MMMMMMMMTTDRQTDSRDDDLYSSAQHSITSNIMSSFSSYHHTVPVSSARDNVAIGLVLHFDELRNEFGMM